MYSSSINQSKFTMWEYNVMWIKSAWNVGTMYVHTTTKMKNLWKPQPDQELSHEYIQQTAIHQSVSVLWMKA